MVNVDVLRRELLFIAENPRKWDQDVWISSVRDSKDKMPEPCGTFGCLAGNTVVHSGGKISWQYSDGLWNATLMVDGMVFVSEQAREILGLSEEESNRLFSSDNNYKDLWDIAIDISKGVEGEFTVEERNKALLQYAENLMKTTRNDFYDLLSEHEDIHGILWKAIEMHEDRDRAYMQYSKAFNGEFDTMYGGGV